MKSEFSVDNGSVLLALLGAFVGIVLAVATSIPGAIIAGVILTLACTLVLISSFIRTEDFPYCLEFFFPRR